MKRAFAVIIISFFLLSCQTRVVSQQKPFKPNSLELYHRYTIQMNDASEMKIQVLRQDSEKIYGKTPTGEEVTINKNEVREIRKPDIFSFVAIVLAGVAAVIFIPI